jgi:hypothetical protein
MSFGGLGAAAMAPAAGASAGATAGTAAGAGAGTAGASSGLASTLGGMVGKALPGMVMNGGGLDSLVRNLAFQGLGAGYDAAAGGAGDWLAGAPGELSDLDLQDVDATSMDFRYGGDADLSALDMQDMEGLGPVFNPQSDFGTMGQNPGAPWMRGQLPTTGLASTVLEDGTIVPYVDPAATTTTLNEVLGTGGNATASGGSTAEEPAPSEAPVVEAPTTGDKIAKYVKLAEATKELLGGDNSSDAPERAEGESDGEYASKLVEYMGLSNEEMAEAGLEPGSPEYMEYILEQADAVIAQITEGLDVNSEELSQQLRAKTEEELQQLQRALYVRGQLDLIMGSGTYTDPFGGAEEEVTGKGFNPHVAAYQRGIARSTGTLAGMGGDDGLNYLNELLGRDVDVFGMQGQQDAAFEQAKRTDEDERRRRRGGMIGF